MYNKRKLFIHGGSSLISKYLIQEFQDEFDEFYIFCRKKEKTKSILEVERFDNKKFFFFENDLNDLSLTLNHIDKLPSDLSGILWITGYTGNPNEEFENIEKAKLNLKVNFINVVVSLTQLCKKIIIHNNSFICVLTSVAGLRGRYKRLYYSAAKGGLINFLSGLRQKFNNKIKVITVIPGYILTNAFQEKAHKLLIVSPKTCSKIIFKGIKNNKEIIFINSLWRIIMWIILLIPEKIFKKLKF